MNFLKTTRLFYGTIELGKLRNFWEWEKEYCQAWSLVWDDTPLFEEDFQAWTNGPVCPGIVL